jgi:hypothetical protein
VDQELAEEMKISKCGVVAAGEIVPTVAMLVPTVAMLVPLKVV